MSRKLLPLVAIILVYLLIAAQYALLTPAWQAPDEPAHYNYVRQLAGGQLPLMAPGDYDQAYLDEIRGARFAPGYPIDEIEYEDWQPPLYYLLLTPFYLLSDGSLVALRLASALLGAGVVLLAGLIAVRLYPQRPWLAWSTAAFVAFIPQHIAILASVNNDALAELLLAAVLYLIIPDPAGWPPARRRLLALLLGFAFLTKATAYLAAPIVGIAILWHYWGEWPQVARLGLQVFLPALLLGALWWGRNAVVYGDWDLLGKTTHDAVVIGQPQTAAWVAELGAVETGRRFLHTTFNSFWGQFGWMAVPMPAWAYRPLLILLLGGAIGLLLGDKMQARRLPWYPALILTLLFLLTAGVHLGYNLTYVQHQGRYLFPALIPISLALSIGLDRWRSWLQQTLSLRQRWLPYLLPLVVGIGLAGLDLLALYRFILPALRLS